MALPDVADDLLDVQDVIAVTHLFQRLCRVEPTMASPADVIPTEEGALGPGEGLEDFLHRAGFGDVINTHGVLLYISTSTFVP